MSTAKERLERLMILNMDLRRAADTLWGCVKPYRRQSTAIARAFEDYRTARNALAEAQKQED